MELEAIVTSAERSRETYFDVLKLLQYELKERYDILIKADSLTPAIKKFLEKRDINYKVDLKKLVKNNIDGIILLGEAFHFVRKTALKNYEFRNPIPLVEITFYALEPTSNDYAAGFLKTFCELMTEDKRSQPNIAFVAEKILPDIASEYKSSLESIERYRRDNHRYEKEKSKIDLSYNKLLDLVIEYTKAIIKGNTEEFSHFRRKRGLNYLLSNSH